MILLLQLSNKYRFLPTTGEVLKSRNTGKKFDLETNLQVAEFKFIDWQGGAESIRQNGIFKDFYELAEDKTNKKKYLYVVGTHYPLKFLNGGRALTSVLSKQPVIFETIKTKYGSNINAVRDYYQKNNLIDGLRPTIKKIRSGILASTKGKISFKK